MGRAQTPSVGFHGGLNMAKISIDEDLLDDDAENKMRFGSSFGARVLFPLSPSFSLESGLTYSMKGTKIEWEGIVEDQTGNEYDGEEITTYKLTYLTIPIMARFYPAPEGSVRPYLKAGPEVGLKLSAKYDYELNVEGDEVESEEGEDLDDVKGLDLGLGLGGGVEMPIGDAMNFFGELGYTLGLLDIFDDDSDESFKNRVFGVSVGMTFNLQ